MQVMKGEMIPMEEESHPEQRSHKTLEELALVHIVVSHSEALVAHAETENFRKIL